MEREPCEMETCDGCEHFEVDCDGDRVGREYPVPKRTVEVSDGKRSVRIIGSCARPLVGDHVVIYLEHPVKCPVCGRVLPHKAFTKGEDWCKGCDRDARLERP